LLLPLLEELLVRFAVNEENFMGERLEDIDKVVLLLRDEEEAVGEDNE
jgi:hypothetical protein